MKTIPAPLSIKGRPAMRGPEQVRSTRNLFPNRRAFLRASLNRYNAPHDSVSGRLRGGPCPHPDRYVGCLRGHNPSAPRDPAFSPHTPFLQNLLDTVEIRRILGSFSQGSRGSLRFLRSHLAACSCGCLGGWSRSWFWPAPIW